MKKLLKKFRCMTVQHENGKPHLHRWYILKTRLFSIYIHNIVSDDDEDMHDHPWPFLVVILKNGYVETMPNGIHIRLPGDIIFHRPSDTHRIALMKYWVSPDCSHCHQPMKTVGIDLAYHRFHGYKPQYPEHICENHECIKFDRLIEAPLRGIAQDSWSLVIMGPKLREWGYHTKQGWVHFKDYAKKIFVGCE